jgi:purine-cytosine permease-like protein
MPLEERAAWVSLAVFFVTTAAYAAVVVPAAVRGPVAEVRWVVPMLWAIGASVVGTVLGSIVAAIGSAMGQAARGRRPEAELGSDERDAAIDRLGRRSSVAVLGVGLLAVLALAMVDAETFWIGNAAYAAGFVASLVEALVKIRAYRRGF